ncbi:MAG: AIPR family protein [Thermoplasmata archaeon]|nr:AIPR family protein [Thermoplasmata archaeon]
MTGKANVGVYWEELASQVGSFQEQYPKLVRDFPHAFPPVVLGLLEEGLDDPAGIDACAVDGKDDCGIDALFIDDQDRRIRVYQFKTCEDQADFDPERLTFNKDGPNDLRQAGEFLAAIREGEELPRHNGQLGRKVGELQKAFAAGYTVLLRLVVSGKLTPYAEGVWRNVRRSLEELGFEPQLVDRRELGRLFQLSTQLTRDPPEKLTVQFLPNHYFFDAPAQVLQGQVRVNEIHTIMTGAEMDVRLLGQNYRHYLGTRGNVGRVNRQILGTLGSETAAPKFHLFNNGLRFTAKSISKGAKKGAFILHFPQLVNGGQTAVCIGEEGPWAHEATVDVKAVGVGEDSTLATQIARATNTQTAIEGWDYWANDDFQRHLLSAFRSGVEPWWYEIKRGEFETAILPRKTEREKFRSSPRGPSYRKIFPDELSKATLCFRGKPVEARIRRSYFPEIDGGLYNEIFNVGLTAAEYLVYFKMYRVVDGIQEEFLRAYGEAEAHSFIDLVPSKSNYAGFAGKGYRRYFTEHLTSAVGSLVHRVLGRQKLGKEKADALLATWAPVAAAVDALAKQVVAKFDDFAFARESVLREKSQDPEWANYFKSPKASDTDISAMLTRSFTDDSVRVVFSTTSLFSD